MSNNMRILLVVQKDNTEIGETLNLIFYDQELIE